MEIQLVPTGSYIFASLNGQQKYYSHCFIVQEIAQGSYVALCHIGTTHILFWTICSGDFLLRQL